MRVPASARRRGKRHVCHGDFCIGVNGLDLDLAGKVGVVCCWRGKGSGTGFAGGVVDDLGGGHDGRGEGR